MVKSRSGSSDVDSSTYVPMIGCFVAGFITNRFLNHQNVVTGELEEGNKGADWEPLVFIWVILAILTAFYIWVLFCNKNEGLIQYIEWLLRIVLPFILPYLYISVYELHYEIQIKNPFKDWYWIDTSRGKSRMIGEWPVYILLCMVLLILGERPGRCEDLSSPLLNWARRNWSGFREIVSASLGALTYNS